MFHPDLMALYECEDEDFDGCSAFVDSHHRQGQQRPELDQQYIYMLMQSINYLKNLSIVLGLVILILLFVIFTSGMKLSCRN